VKIPFTCKEFFDVFEAYNAAIWPAQVVAYILAVVAIILAIRSTYMSDQIVSAILALFWTWIGVFYHIVHFRSINALAPAFGILFVLQGLLLVLFGVILHKLRFGFSTSPMPLVGACFIVYAMVVYPLLGVRLGHTYPRVPMFGVAPCPATIFTFGLLLWAARPLPGYLVIIPLLWSFIGMSAAINLRVPQDYGLVVAGAIGSVLILVGNRKLRKVRRSATEVDAANVAASG